MLFNNTFWVFYLKGNDSDNLYMSKTIREIRYHNARLIQEACGGQLVVIDILGKSQSQVSSIMGDNPSKGIGNKIARQIEKVFGLPGAWLDVWHKTAPAYDPVDRKFIVEKRIVTPELREVTREFAYGSGLSDAHKRLLYECLISAQEEVATMSGEPTDFKSIANIGVYAFNESLKEGLQAEGSDIEEIEGPAAEAN
ncbi:hypothetical protein [Neptuniibacter sp.]|uniref:hypothetical protein n=1 Tax=Neptuniibacter sp. TaxID=1962643 RepID=UPI00260BBC99|nr:hypothetical protein [Neptuniibacter sp.]MCP4597829.1 hypothetical protein [Neptuniibacter sp.]